MLVPDLEIVGVVVKVTVVVKGSVGVSDSLSSLVKLTLVES